MWLEDLILKREKSTSTSTFHEIYQPDKLTKKTTQLLQGQKVTSLPALLCTNVYPSLKICAAEQIPCLHIAILHPAFELSLMLVIEYIYTVHARPPKIEFCLSR